MSGSGEFISHDVLLSAVEGYGWKEGLKTVLKRIPAADVRPVVLCKDCIHCKKGKASLECEKHTYSWNNMRRWVDEDDFCKWGVKREES